MSIASLVTAEHARYVKHFEQSVEQMMAANPQSAREVLVSVNGVSWPYPYRYLRVDLMGGKPDGSLTAVEICLDPPVDIEGRGYSIGPATVEIYPFSWCSTTIAFNRYLRNVAKLEERLTYLLDVGDQRSRGHNFASQAIHSVTSIDTNGEFWFLTIDFGTAPADALLDLIDFLLDEGSTRIIVQTEGRSGLSAEVE